MITLEERVESLEEVFAQFMRETSRILAAIHEDISEIRASNARTDHQLLLLQQQADKDREQANLDRQQAEKDRQQAERDRQQAERDRQQAERDRKDFNRRMAEITDSQGLMIENMVWPNLDRISGQVLGEEAVRTTGIRIKRRHPEDMGRMKEIDLMAVSETAVLVCEAKSKPTSEKVREFINSLRDFPEFFPEYGGMKLVPMVASIAFDPTLVEFMSRQGILALGFGDETMELLNPEAITRD